MASQSPSWGMHVMNLSLSQIAESLFGACIVKSYVKPIVVVVVVVVKIYLNTENHQLIKLN